MTVTDTTTDLSVGEWLIQAREALGDDAPSYRQLSLMLYDRLGQYAASDETLRRWHRPDATVDLAHLTHLAEIYGHRVRDLPASVGRALAGVGDSLRRNACS